MALTKSIQAVFEGSPVSGTHQPVASEVTTLMTELVVDGSNPVTKAGSFLAIDPAALSGYGTGAGSEVTQLTSRTTAVTLNKPCGRIIMFTAAGSATPATFTFNNSLITATDTIILNQRGGANTYALMAKIAAGSASITFWSLSGTASDTFSISFAVVSAVTA